MNWLKELRKSKGFTQDKVTELTGIDRRYISMIENGIRRPSPEVAMRIAEVLGFDWTMFYTKSETEDEKISDPASA